MQPQHHLPAVPIPTNFKYFAPQSKYNTYNNSNSNGNGAGISESQNQLVPQVSPAILQNSASGGDGLPGPQRFLQQQQQQQQINININLTLPRYPYHKNRAIGRKSSHDLQLHDQSSKLFYSNYPPYYSHATSTNSLNSALPPQTQQLPLHPPPPPSHSNVLALAADSSSSSSSSSSTTTINSSTTSGTSSLERSNMMLPSGSSSYLNSYDTISDQQHQQYNASLPHTCPSSPRNNRCASPSCSELDPMLQKSKAYHHKSYKLFKKHHHQQQQLPMSPQASSFSQFTPTFWSAHSNRSSVVSTGTLASSMGFGDEYGSVASSSYPTSYGGTVGIVNGGGGSGSAGAGTDGTSTSSPFAQRRTGTDKQRFSNVYEYKFNNFDLNSIHEDATNET